MINFLCHVLNLSPINFYINCVVMRYIFHPEVRYFSTSSFRLFDLVFFVKDAFYCLFLFFCVCTTCIQATRVQRRPLGSLELELHLVVRLFSHIIILRSLLETNRSQILRLALDSFLQKFGNFSLPNWVTIMSK